MGTWPGSPPDFQNVKPGDFDAEPNWRSMYYEVKAELDALKKKKTEDLVSRAKADRQKIDRITGIGYE